jgi:hypothetical protein
VTGPAARLVVLAGVVLWGRTAGIRPAPLTASAGVVAGAVSEGDPGEILERVQEAAETHAFAGVVVVEWRDGQRWQSEEVPVRSAGGVLRFGDEVVGTGTRRLIHTTNGWLSLWRNDVAMPGPSPTAKYRFSVEPGPDVATRPTDVLAVHLASDGRLWERLYVDHQTGLVLRRELLDVRGQPYRAVAFTAITDVEPGAAPETPRAARSKEPIPAHHIQAPYWIRSKLGAGYRLAGAYKEGRVVQLFFSDGLHGLSIFEERGHLSGPPATTAGLSGRAVEIAGRMMQAYSGSVGEAVVWESDSVVFTVVSDAPWTDVASAVGDLPHLETPGRLQRVARTVVSLFRWR